MMSVMGRLATTATSLVMYQMTSQWFTYDLSLDVVNAFSISSFTAHNWSDSDVSVPIESQKFAEYYFFIENIMWRQIYFGNLKISFSEILIFFLKLLNSENFISISHFCQYSIYEKNSCWL